MTKKKTKPSKTPVFPSMFYLVNYDEPGFLADHFSVVPEKNFDPAELPDGTRFIGPIELEEGAPVGVVRRDVRIDFE